MDWTRGRVLGHGSSATVFLATCPNSGDSLAVKSASLSQSKSLQTEQQILSSLASPHVIGYRGFDVTRENGSLVYNLLMEYAPSGSLADVINRRGGRLDEPTVRFYTRQLLHALQFIHSKGLVHCDVKSSNVLIGPHGAKIADFGCAAWVSHAPAMSGTPLFMAPEVARGEEQGFASDVWSLGCTIIEMSTGGSPWPELTDPVSAVYKIGHSYEVPEVPCFLTHEVKDLLGKCLRRNPKERWTVNQLLKHPIWEEFNSGPKQIQEEYSDSPTSILDQGIWNSMEEMTEPDGDQVQTSPRRSPAEQIGRLARVSGEPTWREDERWMTIRGRGSGKREEVGGGEVCSNNDMDEERRGKEWLDNKVSCRISRNDLADHSCRNRKTSVVHNCLTSPSHTHTNHFVSLLPTFL